MENTTDETIDTYNPNNPSEYEMLLNETFFDNPEKYEELTKECYNSQEEYEKWIKQSRELRKRTLEDCITRTHLRNKTITIPFGIYYFDNGTRKEVIDIWSQALSKVTDGRLSIRYINRMDKKPCTTYVLDHVFIICEGNGFLVLPESEFSYFLHTTPQITCGQEAAWYEEIYELGFRWDEYKNAEPGRAFG